MNPRLARLLTRIYPRSWRQRYQAEFEELLETGHGDFRTVANVAWSGLRERILALQGLMPDQDPGSGRFHSVCARAPWAIFSLGPLFLLAGCYLAACCILWIGWTVLLPGRATPFGGGQHHGLANIYFQFGKYFYAGAPILVGWVIALAAIRQRVKSVWALTGFVLVAWMGAAARIQASRMEVPRGLGHIRMNFVLWPSAHSAHDDLVHALFILSLAVLPYLLWRIRTTRSTVS
jgi:hypothetical protein